MADTQVNLSLDHNDDQMEDVGEETNTNTNEKQQRLKSTVSDGRKAKGRGFNPKDEGEEDRYAGSSKFDSMEEDEKMGPVRSVEGWILFVTGVHEEAAEDSILDKFSEFGPVKNVSLPLDRRTGFVKGYALVEFEKKEQAESAIKELNNTEFMENKIQVDWAFYGKTNTSNSSGAKRTNNSGNRGRRGRK
eukprot:TRINITY_DN2383_c0_g1_i1.p1 TRINITY_DN2383_c0_g1~~TRINITY_DN2383_c0_g1_i1.p1  ORF type:complete len:190 (+),score=82.48 TRINITY_DN2383_c0_g1_i1:160-729(+)